MDVKKLFDQSYDDYSFGNPCADNKYDWAAEEVFHLATYDNEISKLIVEDIFEIIDMIHNKLNWPYIADEDNYFRYILVCQILDQFRWIEWGTSIRGAWLESDKDSRDIIDGVPYTPENIMALIDFVRQGEENNA